MYRYGEVGRVGESEKTLGEDLQQKKRVSLGFAGRDIFLRQGQIVEIPLPLKRTYVKVPSERMVR